MIHLKTRKKGLIEKLADCGLSVPYKYVMDIQPTITKQLCKLYNESGSGCPPRLQDCIFNFAAIVNLDYNPTSTTARKSFHVTSISKFQFLNDASENEVHLPASDSCKNVEMYLPGYYTTVQPTKSFLVGLPVSTVNLDHIKRLDYFEELKVWLPNVDAHIKDDIRTDRVSWSSSHASQRSVKPEENISSAMLPLFQEKLHCMQWCAILWTSSNQCKCKRHL